MACAAAIGYAGMSGRSITRETPAPPRAYGLYTRLHSHAAGRRNGDQFCVYVADRLVLPQPTSEEIEQIAVGRHTIDAFIIVGIWHEPPA